MRIGLYGMPSAGKTCILDRIDFMETAAGSALLRGIDPEFDQMDEDGRNSVRKKLADHMRQKDSFIMDGHYAFGDETAFTEEDGSMYDVFIYLYVEPELLRSRMESYGKNRKYLKHDIAGWQEREISSLREYCHDHDKDFYVIDSPPQSRCEKDGPAIRFIHDVADGFSCLGFARQSAADILNSTDSEEIVLSDGDRTLTIEDSSHEAFGYTTSLFDGNFYTGFQSWEQGLDFASLSYEERPELPVHLREGLIREKEIPLFILTSGHCQVWRQISRALKAKFFCGSMMSAETKFFITKLIQAAGRKVIAYGDGMNDYYMLRHADRGYLVRKNDGSVSRSLKNRDLGGLILV